MLVLAGALYLAGRSTPSAAPPPAPTSIPAPAHVPPSAVVPQATPLPAPPTVAPARPAPTPPLAEAGSPAPLETSAPQPAPEDARLEKAEDLFAQGRYAQAMAEAKAVLARDPGNARAKGLVEDAEVEMLVLNRIREAQAALKRGDKEAALETLRPALAAKPSDSRLLGLWKEATKE